MQIELLYPKVTEAIARAEMLAGTAPEAAPAAHLEVSLLEEQIARLLPVDDEEGAIARRGAVRAAVAAGDMPRARWLVEVYSTEPCTGEALKAELEGLLDLSGGEESAVTPGVRRA